MATASSSSTPSVAEDRDPTRGRWWIVIAAVLVQLALGAVYAWSVFNKPLQDQFGWSKAEAVLPFEVAIGTIFIGSLIGGRIQDRMGPRPVALGGVILYSVGIMLFELLTGRLPFDAKSSRHMISAHVDSEPIDPRTLGVPD